MSNLLMLSGDTLAAQGKDGAFYQMLRRFSAYWDRIDVICPPTPSAGVLHGNVYFHPAPAKWLLPRFIATCGSELIAKRPYALLTSHDYGLFLNGIGAFWLTRRHPIPWVSEIHHIEGYPTPVTYRERLYSNLAMQYIRQVKDLVVGFRVVNQGEMPPLLKELGVPAGKILVLPSLYIDFDIFRPIPGHSSRYDVLFVGRLAPNKGLFAILEALQQVKKHFPQVKLGILGEGSLKAAIQARIEALNLYPNVVFIPPAADMQAVAHIYNQAKMLICASTSEGGPRVTVEAMACGVPVISTPVGIMPELIENGVNGFLTQNRFAEKIMLLLRDDILNATMGAKGRETVQHFQADEVIEQYARGLQSMVK